MLGKLLKYEFKATGRLILPAYLAAVLFALLNRLFVTNSTLQGLWGGRVYGLLIAFFSLAIFMVLALTFVLIIQRFYQNLLKDEGYLSHTLPVTIDKHIFAKLIPATCWTIASSLIVILSILLMTATAGWFPDFLQSFRTFYKEYYAYGAPMPLSVFCLELLLVGIVYLFSGVLSLYAALSIGQLFKKHKILGAVGGYMGLSFIMSLVSLYTTPRIVDNILKPLILGTEMANASFSPMKFTLAMLLTALIGVLYSAIYYFITRYVMTKRLNLE